MKKNVISLGMLVAGFIVGASALTALAQVVGWTPAPANPPANNVAAPINVGDGFQSKSGELALRLFTFNAGAPGSVTTGSVLTATDTSGKVGWGTPIAFSSPGTGVTTPTVTATLTPFTVGPSNAKGAILSFIKPPGCANFVINVFDQRPGGILLGRVWSAAQGDADVNVQQGAGGVMTVPTYNGQIGLQKFLGDDASCGITVIKIADIY